MQIKTNMGTEERLIQYTKIVFGVIALALLARHVL